MKKLLALLLVFVLMFVAVTGCSEGGNDVTTSDSISSDDVSSDDVSSEEPNEETSSEEPVEESDPEDTTEEPYEEPEDPYEEPEDPYEDEEPSVPLSPEEERLANMLAGEDAELNKDALYNEGNLARLAKAIKKGKSGQLVRVVFYGNSVNTAGNSDGTVMADTPYSQLFKYWWEENVSPSVDVTLAGTENLTSINACMRVEHDVLQWEPDIVFLDFAVQDGISSMAKTNSQGYDNLVRRILHSKTSPAVISLILTGAEQNTYTMNPKNANIFLSAGKQQKEIAKYYDIPTIDFESSLWDNMIEVVKVTTYKEEPLITWETLANNNVTMNNDGHMVLYGTIAYFMNKVMAKLDKISTKDPAYPTEGFYGIDKYMTGSFITIGNIIEGEAPGYAFDLDEEGLKKYGYTYNVARRGNTLYPCIIAYRHYIPETTDEADLVLEENPYYLSLTMPKVTNNETYFMFYTTTSVSTKYVDTSRVKFAPITVTCYGENDQVLTSNKAPSGNFVECITLGKTSAVKLAAGTTRVEFKTYTKSGTIRMLGVGSFNN